MGRVSPHSLGRDAVGLAGGSAGATQGLGHCRGRSLAGPRSVLVGGLERELVSWESGPGGRPALVQRVHGGDPTPARAVGVTLDPLLESGRSPGGPPRWRAIPAPCRSCTPTRPPSRSTESGRRTS